MRNNLFISKLRKIILPYLLQSFYLNNATSRTDPLFSEKPTMTTNVTTT